MTIHPAADALDRNRLIDIAKAEKETAFFNGDPPVYLISGEPVTKEHFVATSGLAHMLPDELELAGQTGRRNAEVIGNFLDLLKGSGIVITGEDILRNDLTTTGDWKRRFAVWVEQGRFRGVTFHIAAAGYDGEALLRLFSNAELSSQHFLMHLRNEPVGEVQRAFSARADS